MGSRVLNEELYDVIIVGAGISGLFLAKELSNDNKILVIDKNEVKNVHKCITGFRFCFQDDFLKQYISAEFNTGYVKSLYSDKLYIKTSYVSLDEDKLTSDIVRIIIKNGGNILENTKFIKILDNNDKHIEISTSNGNFKSKLLIDCTGHESIIANEYKMYKQNFYYNIYGGIYNLKLEDAIVYEILEEKTPIRFIEVIPINNKQVVIYAFDFNRKNINDKKFENVEEKYMKKLNLPIEQDDKKEEIYGTIQTGVLKSNSLNRVFLYGEAGLVAPIMTGFGFNNIVKTYKQVSSHLNRCLKENRLKSQDLKYKYSKKMRMNQNFQLLAALLVSNMNVKNFSKFQKSILKNTEDSIKFSTCNLTKKEIYHLSFRIIKDIGLSKILKLIKFKDIPLFIKTFIKLLINRF